MKKSEIAFLEDIDYLLYGDPKQNEMLARIISSSKPNTDPEIIEGNTFIPVDMMEFEGDSDSMCCFVKKLLLFSFYYDQDLNGFVCEVDENSPTKLVSIQEMMKFPSFVPFVVCEECDGKGFYKDRDCNVGSASECCGGCEVTHDCDCEGVLFYLD